MNNFFLIVILFFVTTCDALPLHRVILSTDNNPLYSEFWPIVSKAWKQIVGLKPTLAVIARANELPLDESLGHIIRFEPIDGVPTSFYAQVVRLLLPILFDDEVCIISDIDMLPLNKNYFIDSIATIPDDNFVVYRDRVYGPNATQYPMCYIAAQGRTFKNIFKIASINQIPEVVKMWYSIGLGWHTDELLLFWYLHQWKDFSNKCIRLGHSIKQRIDRAQWNYDSRLINADYYIDAHMFRPYSLYKREIDTILKLIGVM